MATEVGKTEIECDRAHFAQKTNLFGGQVFHLLLHHWFSSMSRFVHEVVSVFCFILQKTERLGDENQWNCALVDLNGLRFRIVKRNGDQQAQSQVAMPAFDDYFAPVSGLTNCIFFYLICCFSYFLNVDSEFLLDR